MEKINPITTQQTSNFAHDTTHEGSHSEHAIPECNSFRAVLASAPVHPVAQLVPSLDFHAMANIRNSSEMPHQRYYRIDLIEKGIIRLAKKKLKLQVETEASMSFPNVDRLIKKYFAQTGCTREENLRELGQIMGVFQKCKEKVKAHVVDSRLLHSDAKSIVIQEYQKFIAASNKSTLVERNYLFETFPVIVALREVGLEDYVELRRTKQIAQRDAIAYQVVDRLNCLIENILEANRDLKERYEKDRERKRTKKRTKADSPPRRVEDEEIKTATPTVTDEVR